MAYLGLALAPLAIVALVATLDWGIVGRARQYAESAAIRFVQYATDMHILSADGRLLETGPKPRLQAPNPVVTPLSPDITTAQATFTGSASLNGSTGRTPARTISSTAPNIAPGAVLDQPDGHQEDPADATRLLVMGKALRFIAQTADARDTLAAAARLGNSEDATLVATGSAASDPAEGATPERKQPLPQRRGQSNTATIRLP